MLELKARLAYVAVVAKYKRQRDDAIRRAQASERKLAKLSKYAFVLATVPTPPPRS
jgi:chorismate mutase